jgi:membrane protease subunit HflK
MRRALLLILPALAASFYLATGFFNVEPDETGVTFFLGAIDERHAEPGIHWIWPRPFGRRVVAKTATNLSVPIGYEPGVPFASVSRRAPDLWVTGGTSIIRARLDVQYTIADLADYSLISERPIDFMRAAGEQVITRLLVMMNVDDALTTGRQTLREQVMRDLQSRLDAARIGIKILSVNIEELSPPKEGEVDQAFQQVQSARSDRERSVQNAYGESAKTLSQAQAKAQALISQAAADRYSRVEIAKGEAARFSALSLAYQKAPENTEMRLYLESIERLMPKLRVYVVDPTRPGQFQLRTAK